MVEISRQEERGETFVTAAHDGYVGALRHPPRAAAVACRAMATRLDGVDSFTSPSGAPIARGGKDCFAIRFHLHPAVKASRIKAGQAVLLVLARRFGLGVRDRRRTMSLIEESIRLSDIRGSRRAEQIVIHGRALQPGAVHWRFAEVDEAGGRADVPKTAGPKCSARRGRCDVAGCTAARNHAIAPARHDACIEGHMAVPPPKVDLPDLVPMKRALFSVFDHDRRASISPGRCMSAASGCSRRDRRPRRSSAPACLSPMSPTASAFPKFSAAGSRRCIRRSMAACSALRNDPVHAAEMAEHGIEPFDLVVSNLYPFEKTIATTDDYATIVENIDIGGPAMTRAAAKNHGFVSILVDPADYARASRRRSTPMTVRRRWHIRKRLAAKAFARTAAYDAAVSNWFAARARRADAGMAQPRRHADGGDALWRKPASAAPRSTRPASSGRASSTARQLQGKQLSYNNINDTDAAYELVAEFDPAASGGRRDHQARQSLRRRHRRLARRGL